MGQRRKPLKLHFDVTPAIMDRAEKVHARRQLALGVSRKSETWRAALARGLCVLELEMDRLESATRTAGAP